MKYFANKQGLLYLSLKFKAEILHNEENLKFGLWMAVSHYHTKF